MLLVSLLLRAWPLLCFFFLVTVVDSLVLSLRAAGTSLAEAAGLSLGRAAGSLGADLSLGAAGEGRAVEPLDCVFGIVAAPLSSAPLLGLAGLAVVLVSVVLLVCARAPTAERAIASALMLMIRMGTSFG
jgi:hypothetical protein